MRNGPRKRKWHDLKLNTRKYGLCHASLVITLSRAKPNQTKRPPGANKAPKAKGHELFPCLPKQKPLFKQTWRPDWQASVRTGRQSGAQK